MAQKTKANLKGVGTAGLASFESFSENTRLIVIQDAADAVQKKQKKKTGPLGSLKSLRGQATCNVVGETQVSGSSSSNIRPDDIDIKDLKPIDEGSELRQSFASLSNIDSLGVKREELEGLCSKPLQAQFSADIVKIIPQATDGKNKGERDLMVC
jgi:hypothetical protein